MLEGFRALGYTFDFDRCLSTRKKEDAESIAAYRAAQPATPSSEEVFEARAAFGPGVEVVDVFTGRKFRT